MNLMVLFTISKTIKYMKHFKTNEDCLKIKTYTIAKKKFWRIQLRGMDSIIFPALYTKRKRALQVKLIYLSLLQKGYYITLSSSTPSRLVIRKPYIELLLKEGDTYVFRVKRNEEECIYTSWIQLYNDADGSQKGYRLYGLVKIGDTPIKEINKERLIYIANRDPFLTGFCDHLLSLYITEPIGD